MTSPELPIFQSPAGMIWDGVTEYQDVPQQGIHAAWLCRMYQDGTRRFSDAFVTGGAPG